jgi:hypothetical protein
MALGAGRYDDLCTRVRDDAKARSAVIIVVGGEYGHGFSVQAPAEDAEVLIHVLRDVADQIETDMKALPQGKAN